MERTFTWAYRADGQPSSFGQPNGNTTALGYDSTGHLTGKTTTAPGPISRAAYAWTWNRAGSILSEASTITSDPTNNTRTFGYDPLGRLAAWTDGALTTTFGWDAVLNRTSVQAGANPAVTTTYDPANRPLADSLGGVYASDADGRLTARPDATGAPSQRMTWDSLGRLTSVRNGTGTLTLATYTYDPLDRLRLVDYGAGNRVRFRYVGLTTSAVQTIDDATGAVIRHIGTGWGGELLLDWTGSGQDIRIYGRNAHHDLTWTAGTSGTVTGTVRYDPVGVATSVTGSVPAFRFQGSWADDVTKLSWVVTRWYAPAQGRFISEDSLLGEPRDPDSRHLYAYGAGDPVGAWDPDGRHTLYLDHAEPWSSIAYFYYGTKSVATSLADTLINGYADPKGMALAYRRYTLPDRLRNGVEYRSHTVYGRDDPVLNHRGMAFGAPYVGSPLQDGAKAWWPWVLAPGPGQDDQRCFGPWSGRVPSASGTRLSTTGWKSRLTAYGAVWPDSVGDIGYVHPVIQAVYQLAAERRYTHGTLVTMWLNYDFRAFNASGSSDFRFRSVSAQFKLQSGSPYNGSQPHTTTRLRMDKWFSRQHDLVECTADDQRVREYLDSAGMGPPYEVLCIRRSQLRWRTRDLRKLDGCGFGGGLQTCSLNPSSCLMELRGCPA